MTTRRIALLLVMFMCGITVAHGVFNEFGVWHAIDTETLSAGEVVSAGTIDVTSNETEINVLLYCVAVDTTWVTLNLYGMMTYTKADTVKGVLLGTKTEYTADSTVVYADTLEAGSAFPFLYLQVKNAHPSEANIVDAYLYTRPIQRSIIR